MLGSAQIHVINGESYVSYADYEALEARTAPAQQEETGTRELLGEAATLMERAANMLVTTGRSVDELSDCARRARAAASLPSGDEERCENCDMEELARSCRHELEGEALDDMERLGFEIVVHREDEGACFSSSLGRMLGRLAAARGERDTVFVDELRAWVGTMRAEYEEDDHELLDLFVAFVDERAAAPPSGETGGDWRSDPEAISGLVAHSLDVNHGRSSFAIAQAVVDDLTQHGVLSPTACAKCGSRDAAPCAEAACPRYGTAPPAGETGVNAAAFRRATTAGLDWSKLTPTQRESWAGETGDADLVSRIASTMGDLHVLHEEGPPEPVNPVALVEHVLHVAEQLGETGDGRELREWVLSCVGEEGEIAVAEGPGMTTFEEVRVREIPSEGGRTDG